MVIPPATVRIAGAAVLLLIVGGCYLVLAPFLSAVVWALILAVSLQPLMVRLLRHGHFGPGAAAALITLLCTAVLLLPVIMLLPSLSELTVWLFNRIGDIIDQGLPSAPAWLRDVPLFGDDLVGYWQRFEHDGSQLVAELRKYIVPLRDFLLAAGAGLGRGLLELALSLGILYFMLRDGPRWAARLYAVAGHLIGVRGGALLEVARQTIRGVVNGILGTSLAQALLAGVGFWVAGVDNALFLGFLTFFLSFVPMGPALLWVPAAIGLYRAGDTGWAAFLAVWGALVVGTVDNILRPLLMQRGMDLPFLFIFLGVLGGALAFGLTGVFIGPTLLAVGYTLLRGLTETPPTPTAAGGEGPAPR